MKNLLLMLLIMPSFVFADPPTDLTVEKTKKALEDGGFILDTDGKTKWLYDKNKSKNERQNQSNHLMALKLLKLDHVKVVKHKPCWSDPNSAVYRISGYDCPNLSPSDCEVKIHFRKQGS